MRAKGGLSMSIDVVRVIVAVGIVAAVGVLLLALAVAVLAVRVRLLNRRCRSIAAEEDRSPAASPPDPTSTR